MWCFFFFLPSGALKTQQKTGIEKDVVERKREKEGRKEKKSGYYVNIM